MGVLAGHGEDGLGEGVSVPHHVAPRLRIILCLHVQGGDTLKTIHSLILNPNQLKRTLD